MSECLIDKTVPLADRPKWAVGYQECGAGLYLAQSQMKQAAIDDAEAKRTGRPVPTSHRLWQVGRRTDN